MPWGTGEGDLMVYGYRDEHGPLCNYCADNLLVMSMRFAGIPVTDGSLVCGECGHTLECALEAHYEYTCSCGLKAAS